MGEVGESVGESRVIALGLLLAGTAVSPIERTH